MLPVESLAISLQNRPTRNGIASNSVLSVCTHALTRRGPAALRHAIESIRSSPTPGGSHADQTRARA
mgnify:CR=1 FL=1